MMRNHVIRWLINTLAIYLAIRYVHGIHFDGSPVELLVVAALFGLVNAILKPILTVLTCPLVLLTLGLFTFVINALMLMCTAWLSQKFDLGFAVDGFRPAFWAGLLIGVVSLALTMVLGEHKVVVVRRDGER
jgi:putative membrane protein